MLGQGGMAASLPADELWYIRDYAADQGQPINRHSLFLRADWADAFIPKLELGGFIDTDLNDGSSLLQFGAMPARGAPTSAACRWPRRCCSILHATCDQADPAVDLGMDDGAPTLLRAGINAPACPAEGCSAAPQDRRQCDCAATAARRGLARYRARCSVPGPYPRSHDHVRIRLDNTVP